MVLIDKAQLLTEADEIANGWTRPSSGFAEANNAIFMEAVRKSLSELSAGPGGSQ
jgi:hypothetical protein